MSARNSRVTRGSIIASLPGEGLDNGAAANLPGGAVDAYGPQGNAVVGD